VQEGPLPWSNTYQVCFTYGGENSNQDICLVIGTEKECEWMDDGIFGLERLLKVFVLCVLRETELTKCLVQ